MMLTIRRRSAIVLLAIVPTAPAWAAEVLEGKICLFSVSAVDPSEEWKENLMGQLGLPYLGHDVGYLAEYEPIDMKAAELEMTLIQGFALDRATEAVSRGDETSSGFTIRQGQSGADIGRAIRNLWPTARVAVFVDSAVVMGAEVRLDREVPGISIVNAPLVDLVCNLELLEGNMLAEGFHCEDESSMITMFVVPTRRVLCRMAASGYEAVDEIYKSWTNTSFVPFVRTSPESRGLYRRYLPAHEVAHVLLDGGADVHSSSSDDLLHLSGGRGRLTGPAFRRMVAKSGPDASPDLLRGTSAAARGRAVQGRHVNMVRRVSPADCTCEEVAARVSDLLPSFGDVFGYLTELDHPVAAFPVLADALDRRGLASDFWEAIVTKTIPLEATAFVPDDRDPTGEATAVLFAAASSGAVCTGNVPSCTEPGCPSAVEDALGQVRAADEACRAWRSDQVAGEEKLAFLERYIRNGFNFITGQESYGLYDGGQPVVRWARTEFAGRATRRDIRALEREDPLIDEFPAYREYLMELAGD